MHKSAFAFVAIVPLLTSCAFMDEKPSVVSSSPQGVTIKFNEGHIDDATSKADKICQVQRRKAVLQRVTPQNEKKRIASFDCR